jgi:hypothetical protein
LTSVWGLTLTYQPCHGEGAGDSAKVAAGRAGQDDPVRRVSDIEALGRWVIDHYADSESARYGILDATKAPYSADPTGRQDATQALQQALKDARDARLITYLPGGTYRVSDTLTCIQGQVRRDQWAFGEADPAVKDVSYDFPCVLMGSRTANRSQIVLASGSRGFGDPQRPKPVIYFWARGASWGAPPDPNQPVPNISFNQMIVDVDISLGRGNVGAIGIDHQAAQGSVIEDVTVDASGALAGIQKAPGSGGGIHGLTVLGGRYGLLLRGSPSEDPFWRGAQPVPVVSNLTLKGQTERAIFYDGRGPLTVVGGWIEGAGVQAQSPRDQPWNGAMNFVDTVFHIQTGTCAITSNHSVFLHEVYFEYPKGIACVEGQPRLEGLPQHWTHIEEYVAAATLQYPQRLGGATRRDAVYLDGQPAPAQSSVRMDSSAPPADLQSRHALPQLPPWNDSRVANVQAAPYGAKGDGMADDAPAIQRAIDEHEAVFLPKGQYKLSRPLMLKSHTRLFGLTNILSVLSPMMQSPEYRHPGHPAPIIDTVDDAYASTYLAFLELLVPVADPAAYALRWRVGRASVVRDVNPLPTFWDPNAPPRFHAMIRIEASGGGRWYDLDEHVDWWNQGPDYRHLLVDGTREPLAFYMLNPEHASSEAQVEFRDAQNVNVYSLKGEGMFTTVWMRKCRAVRIYGYGGVGAPRRSRPMFRIETSEDFLLANIDPETLDLEDSEGWSALGIPSDPREWILISDSPGTPKAPIELHGIDQVALYKRGNPYSGP